MLDPYADIFSTLEKPFHHHSNASTVRGALAALGFEWEEFLSFTTIRNPWARAVSFWEYGEKNPQSVWSKRRKETGTFEAFCVSLPRGTAADRFCGEDGDIIVKRIICLEDVDEAFTKIATDLRIKLIGADGTPLDKPPASGSAVAHVNATEHADYRTYHTPRSRQAIADTFASDIEIGGYSF
ncbi:MAG: hypothetical protein AAGJ32_12950 [Pseudomonadota bacterium]